ncbi:hypothetical protein A3K78_09475 [Candidatus Bathyarchaeota archaeon RBG_13_52_12]|nr:MAG: hypothetical protein A3K78_09475 [Candidatus Bathyarchaeota archaeon RBG_13_52_12]
MSEEKKPEVETESEEKSHECCESQGEQQYNWCGHHGPWGHHGGHWMHKRMMMHFVSMSVEEEVELLESAKARLEERLKVVNERLSKLKA